MKKFSDSVKKLHEDEDEKVTLKVEIGNLKPAQAENLKRLLYFMDDLGKLGSSRDVKVFVDGDGAFRPDVLIDGVNRKDSGIDLSDLDPETPSIGLD